MANPVPLFTPAIITQPTDEEWTVYRHDVNVFYAQITQQINTKNPEHQIEAAPMLFTENPTTTMGRLDAARQTTAWLYRLHALAAPEAPPEVTIDQLLQVMVLQVQALTMTQAMAAPPSPPASPIQSEVPYPPKYTGNPRRAQSFLMACEKYFALFTPTTVEYRIRFVLQIMKGGAEQWKLIKLCELENANPPAWSTTWELFKAEFNLRFEDRQERERALDKLLNGKVVQTTSARNFIDLVVDTCQKAGWNDQVVWYSVARHGLKREVAMSMVGSFPSQWNDFVATVIQVDEHLQLQWEREQPTENRTASSSSTITNRGPKRNNSKFKLTEEERKEHIEQNLCFKCHKKGHTSRDCNGKRTVYAQYKERRPGCQGQCHKANPKIQEGGHHNPKSATV